MSFGRRKSATKEYMIGDCRGQNSAGGAAGSGLHRGEDHQRGQVVAPETLGIRICGTKS